jgi:PAS domain-containing protein
MGFSECVVLDHSWPLWEQPRQFDLGSILNCAVTDAIEPVAPGNLGLHHAGLWECDLSDNSLVWSGGVYDLFGFPRGASVSRQQALACYTEHSRAILEHLRAYAIRHRRGFTLDVKIEPVTGEGRLVRLIGAPVCEEGQVVRLHGLKMLI